MPRLISFLICILFCANILAQNTRVHLIPQPISMEEGSGEFLLDAQTQVKLTQCTYSDIHLLMDQLRNITGYKLHVQETGNSNKTNLIEFRLSEELKNTHPDAYTLEADAKTIVIEAASTRGLFYASQSLRQLLPVDIESTSLMPLAVKWSIPEISILDYPRFEWRGFMMDVSRTFYSVEVLKKYMDIMALYKLSVFHLHLTDDQGWRIEIKKYPELTTKKTTVFAERHNQPENRSGYYTQEDIKELVSYAAARHIDIIPEIDVPGHCWPIILVKPELGTNSKKLPDYVFPFMDSWSYWGYQFTPNPLDPTKEEVYDFLSDVFSELAVLFPSQYVHFGGDEVVHRLWDSEPHIQQFMETHSMSKIEELQSYFVTRISQILVAKGKIPIGWNDILADVENLPKSTAIMSWLGADAVKIAAENDFYTVATPTSPLYFDITQQSRHDGTMADLNYGAINSIDKVYAYNPIEGLEGDEVKYVLGMQANMWPAVPQEVKDVNVQNFPRLIALAENAWTPLEQKNFKSFKRRLEKHYEILDLLNIDYFKDGGYVIGQWDPEQIDTTFNTLQWDVTEHIYSTGRVQAGFFYTGGDSYLKVKNVQLLQNGRLIAHDEHLSIADKFRGIPYKKDMFLYSLEATDYDADASYTLKADVCGETSNNSNGNVTFNLSPFESFKFTQPRIKLTN